MAILKVIYASDQAWLQKYYDEATHWLPENDLSITPSYKPPEVICTTADTILETIEILIKSGHLAHNEVVYLVVENPTVTIAYVFKEDGTFNNFFRV
jgi:hypothetical protein